MSQRVGFHPAEYVEDELRERGWTLDDLASAIPASLEQSWGVRRLALDLYMNVRTPDALLGTMAEWFAAAFNTSPALWRNLDAQWRESLPRPTPDPITQQNIDVTRRAMSKFVSRPTSPGAEP